MIPHRLRYAVFSIQLPLDFLLRDKKILGKIEGTWIEGATAVTETEAEAALTEIDARMCAIWDQPWRIILNWEAEREMKRVTYQECAKALGNPDFFVGVDNAAEFESLMCEAPVGDVLRKRLVAYRW